MHSSNCNGNFTRDGPPLNSTIAHSRNDPIKHDMAKRKVIEDERKGEAESVESSSEESSSEDVCISTPNLSGSCVELRP